MEGFRPYDIADPFPFYARARAEAPVFFSEELGYYVVSRYEDILAIFKDPATFSSENTQAPFKPRPPEVQAVFDEADMSHSSGLSGRQPPDHTRLRGFIKKAFTPRRIAALEPQVRELTTRAIDAFAARGRADLVAELARDLPAHVIFRLLGVPDEDVPRVKAWAVSRVYLNFGDISVDQQVKHAKALVEYWRYCLDLVDRSFANPGDDLPGDLARIYLEGDHTLTREEIAGLVHTQLFAGHETTSSLLGAGLAELLSQPGKFEALRDDHSLIPTAVEELLRLVTPVFAWKRVTKRPARVADTELPENANVLLLLGSANRDDTVFEHPDEVDLHRANAHKHLSFGHGIHFCLGAALARLEAQVVLEELTQRLPNLRLVEQELRYTPNTTFRGLEALHAEWDPAIVPLRECRDVSLVGGKAAGLAALMDAGLPVPDGFAITVHARDEDIAAAYRALGENVPVAVRSSATTEDSSDASFAGEHDTYLWVVGERAVLEAVAMCRASLNTARAVAYRADRGIEGEEMAVVVQRMVRADAAGVAMTLNPANGDRCTVAIESAYGLGETVVGGTVTPDRFLVDKVMLDVVETHIADKHVELTPEGLRDVEPERRTAPSLTTEQVRAIAALAKRAEQHHGAPQDLEWAVENGEVLLLQCRPETVWSKKAAPRPASIQGGLLGIVDTLVNPLASRRSTHVRASD
ncbi:MAG TPA: cytochrome P450 [Solirubrobacter sp.]|nr:cytochrome P450 [Solirubrobacter sp.]